MAVKSMNDKIIIIFKELFFALTAALAIFIALETVWPGVILAYLNINWVLILWLIVGILVLLFNNKLSGHD